jgi:MFS family permease
MNESWIPVESPLWNRPRGRKIYVLVLLCAAYLVSMLDRQIVSLLVEPIKTDLGLSDTQIGLLQGFGFVVFYATLGVPLARFADRGNRTRLIAAGMAVWSLAAMASGAARGFVGLFAARVFIGAGEATLSPAAYSILGETFDQRRLGRVIGIFHMAAGVGLGLALVIGGWIYGLLQSEAIRHALARLSLAPWQGTFIAVGLPGLLLAAVILTTMREPAQQLQRGRVLRIGVPPKRAGVGAYLWSNRRVYFPLYGGFAVFTAYIYAFLAWTPALLIRTFGLSAATVGKQLGVILMLGAGVGCLLGGSLSDKLFVRYGITAPLRALKRVSVAVLLPAVAAPLVPNATLSMTLLGLAFLGGAAAQPLLPVALRLMAPRNMQARLSALWLCVNNLVGFGLGPFVVALFTDHVFGASQIRFALSATFLIALLPAIIGFSRALHSLSSSSPMSMAPSSDDEGDPVSDKC